MNSRNKKQVAILSAVVVLAGFFAGCSSNKAEVKNMEQLYAENGVPVKTRVLAPTGFSTELEYTAALSGIKESSAYALITDKVDKVNVAVGDRVNKDDVVMTFPTDNPSARYYQAKVAFDNAETSFRRMESYFETGGLSRQDFDNAKASFEVAKADWDAVRQSVMVRAPISGIVTRVNVQESDNVQKEDELFVVAQTDRLRAKFWVPEKQISSFKEGLTAMAQWNGVSLHGRVTQVDLSFSVQRQAFGVVVELDNPGSRVPAGVTANVQVETYTRGDAIVVERKDLVSEGPKYFAFVVVDGKAQKRAVELGNTEGLDVEIAEGLNIGDVLVVEGQLHLKNGSKIQLAQESTTETSTVTHP